MLHRDGTRYSEGLIPQSVAAPSFPSFVEARVDEVIYTDDPRNSTFNNSYKEVQYNCTIIRGALDGQRIFNVRDTVESGGQYNKSAQVRSPTRKGKIEPPITEPGKTDGEFVLIALVNNNPYQARIIRGLPHPLSDAMDIKKAQGEVKSWEFNGVTFGINKDGALEIGFGGGPKDVNGAAANESASGSSIVMTKEGSVTLTDSKGQSVSLDSENQKVVISADQGMEIAAGTTMEIEISGTASIQASGTFQLKGATIMLQSGGIGAARIGDIAVGTGNQGAPVVSTIQTGSSTTLIGG